MQQNSSHKLYILVDKTLSISQRTVQACHASIEFAKAFPDWKHQSIVILAVDGERELLDYYKRILGGHTRVGFQESYWDNRFTAIACHGCDDLVKDLPLL